MTHPIQPPYHQGPTPNLHTRAWNETLTSELYRRTDEAERFLRSTHNVTDFEKLQELSGKARGGAFGPRSDVASNSVLGASVVGCATAGALVLGPVGAILGGIGGLFLGGEAGVLGSKVVAEHRLSSFLDKVTGQGAATTPSAGPMAALPTSNAPTDGGVQIPADELQKAMFDRFPSHLERAAMTVGSDRLHELETKTTRQLLIERGVRDDVRVLTPWSYPTENHVACDTVFDASTGSVYTGVGQGHSRFLTAFDTNGRVKWSHSGAEMTCPPVVADGTVYFRTRGNLLACNASGVRLWEAPTTAGSSWEDRPPAVAPDGTVYVIDSLSGIGHEAPNMCLRAVKDGQELWKFDVVGDHTGDPQVLRGQDGTVYLTAALREREHSLGGLLAGDSKEQDYLIALRPNGTLKFKAAVSSWPSYVATSLSEGLDGTIYAAHGGQSLTAFSPDDGHALWNYRCMDRRIVEHSSAHSRLTQAPGFDADGNVYVTTGISSCYPEGYLVRLDSQGKEQWVRAVDGGISSRPHLGPDGLLYLTTSRGELRSFDTAGNQVSATVVGDVSWSNFAFGSDGQLFLNTDRQIMEFQPDADKAREKIFAPEPEPIVLPPKEGGKIQDDGDYVIIGGMRLKRRNTAEAGAPAAG